MADVILKDALESMRGQTIRVVNEEGKVLYTGIVLILDNLTDLCQNMWVYRKVKSTKSKMFEVEGVRQLCLEVTVI